MIYSMTPTLLYGFFKREDCGERWAAGIDLLFRFKIHIFCVPRNPTNIAEFSHKAQEV